MQRTDQVAMSFSGNAETANAARPNSGAASQSSSATASSGFREIRRLSPTLGVFALSGAGPAAPQRAGAPNSATVAAEQEPGVDWVSPVYVNSETGANQVAADEVIVALKPGVDPATYFGSDPRFSGYRPLLGTPDQFVATVAAGGGEAAIDLANDLMADPKLDWAAPNFYQDFQKQSTPNDPLFPQQWHLENTGQFGGTPDADVDALAAWAITPGGSSDIVVAIVDDGMEFTHPDLLPNLFINAGEIPNNGIDDDGNGWIDDVNGWDFTTNGSLGDNNPGASSVNDAHATSVAGVTAAVGNNNLGVVGIAYRSRLLPIRIFGDSGSATTDANIASAIYYAAGRTANGLGTWRAADILNNSWGGGAASTAITTAFNWASATGRNGRGAISFIATGNSGASAISYPANLAGTISGVIAVGASNNLEVRSSYSQFGPQIDFVAPSNGGTFGIVTVDRQGTNGYNSAAGSAGDYTNTAGSAFGGTSSATPLAAGIGALVLALDPTLTASQVRGLMRNTTDLIGPVAYVNGFNTQYGYGRVNAATAVSGVGVAEIQVLDGAVDVPNNGSAAGFSALVSQTQTRTFRVRNQGTQDLELGAINLAAGPFSLVTGFGDTTLSVGEATTFIVSFTPTTGGPAASTLSFSTNDADESLFSITLSGNGIVASVAGYAFEDWDGNGARDINEPGLPGWQVYLDRNGNQVFDGDPAFTVSPNQAIPDNNATGITSAQTVSGLAGTITDLNVRININHTFVSDLVIELISPAGTTVSLINRRGSSGDNFTNTVLDDQAATSITTITAAGAPFTGSFRPESPLAAVNGQNPNGVWQLRVSDRASLDVGTLVNWSLIFGGYGEPATTTDSQGFYSFLSLDPGVYNVRRTLQSGWNATAPAGGGYSVTIVDANTSITDRNFGQARQNAIYGQSFNDLNSDGFRGIDEPGAGGWRVYLDRNGNGAFDGDPTFTVSPNQVIPDNNATGITSAQTVSGLDGPITDLNVRININHTFVGDLVLSLVSPAGTTVSLINRRGSSGDNFTNTVLDDQAATSITTITAAGAPFTGSFRPESPLSALNGQNGNGVWQLRVSDRASIDVGTLVNWSLIFEGEPSLVTPNSGNYIFTNLAAGAYNVRQVNQLGWRPTAPVGGVYNVNLSSGATALGNNFGNFRDLTPPTADIVDVSPDPRATPVESVAITFDESVTGFDIGDLRLTRNDSPVSLATASLTGGGATYSLSNLSGLTAADGSYLLTLVAAGSGIVDLAGNALASDASDAWLTDTVAPVTTAAVSGATKPLCPADCFFGSATVTLNASDDSSGVANTFYRVNGGGFQTYGGPFAIASEGANVVEFFSVDLAGNDEATRTITVKVTFFPTTGLLDTFNRSNGRVGSNWSGATQSDQYVIAGQQVDVGKGGMLTWQRTTFGVDQEAFMTLTAIDRASAHHTLLLKSRGANSSQGGILVNYDAVQQRISVEALVVGQGWRTVASFPASMAVGDQLGARALADGTVKVYVNCGLVGTADTRSIAGNAYVNVGGQIGVWFLNAANAAFDNFGGGNFTP